MKKILLSSFSFAFLLASLSVFAAPLHDGVVKKLDQKKATVTLQHGDIAEAGMPAMTMSYPVRHAQELANLHPNDKVRFALEKKKENYIVMHIEAVKP